MNKIEFAAFMGLESVAPSPLGTDPRTVVVICSPITAGGLVGCLLASSRVFFVPEETFSTGLRGPSG